MTNLQEINKKKQQGETIMNNINNEYDILLRIQMRADALIEETKESLFKNKEDKINKIYIIENLYTEINNILNIAFCNNPLHDYINSENVNKKILPTHYIKPDKEFLELLKIIETMDNKQLNELLNKAEEIKGAN